MPGLVSRRTRTGEVGRLTAATEICQTACSLMPVVAFPKDGKINVAKGQGVEVVVVAQRSHDGKELHWIVRLGIHEGKQSKLRGTFGPPVYLPLDGWTTESSQI